MLLLTGVLLQSSTSGLSASLAAANRLHCESYPSLLPTETVSNTSFILEYKRKYMFRISEEYLNWFENSTEHLLIILRREKKMDILLKIVLKR